MVMVSNVVTEFVVDDFRAARGFVKSLPKKTREARFVIHPRTKEPHKWTPSHLVLARQKGRTVAMADALYDETGSAAHAAVVSMPGFGAYALRCLVRLQKEFPVAHWEASLRNPSPATVAIGRHYFDVVYDQTAWQMSQETANTFGADTAFSSTPLFVTKVMLAKYGLRRMSDLDEQTRRQIFEVARLPTDAKLVAPNGAELHFFDAVPFAFDLLDAPMSARQDVCRLTASMQLARAAGTLPDPDGLKKVLNMRRAADLVLAIEKASRLE